MYPWIEAMPLHTKHGLPVIDLCTHNDVWMCTTTPKGDFLHPTPAAAAHGHCHAQAGRRQVTWHVPAA